MSTKPDQLQVKRWTGNLKFSQKRTLVTLTNTTLKLAGVEPLAVEVTERFDQLVRDKNFDAPYIALIGQEGLRSPIDVIGSRLPGAALLAKSVIEVVTRTADLGGAQLTIVEHREVAQELDQPRPSTVSIDISRHAIKNTT